MVPFVSEFVIFTHIVTPPSVIVLGGCVKNNKIVSGIWDAENSLFTSDGRYFVTGNLIKPQLPEFSETPKLIQFRN